MAVPQALQQVIKRPGMYFSPVEFDVAAAFVEGFDLASGGGVLVGFREWLITKLGYGNNLAWPELVSSLAFQDAESPRQQLQGEGEKRSLDLLFRHLEEFWQERDAPNGLRQIYLRYHEWLKTQDWYGPSSPHFIADGSGRYS